MSESMFESLVPFASPEKIGLGVGRRTLGRLAKNPPPGFPIVIRMNHRLFVRRAELETYKQRLIAEALAALEPAAPAPKAA